MVSEDETYINPSTSRNIPQVLLLLQFQKLQSCLSEHKISYIEMFLLALASVLVAKTTLGICGPIDMTFEGQAVEQLKDFSSLYASDVSNSAVCLTCECGKTCPPSCGCNTPSQSPAQPNTVTSPTGPDQHCGTGAKQEHDTADLCPWECKDGICLCYNYCSKNYCDVYNPDGSLFQFEGSCVSANGFYLSQID